VGVKNWAFLASVQSQSSVWRWGMRHGFFLFKVTMALGLSAALVVYLDLERLVEMWRRLPLWRLLVCASFTAIGLGIQWLKWALLARVNYPALGAAQIGRSLLGGFALGLVSPGRWGELGRGAFLPGKTSVYVALAAFDRALSFMVTLVLGVAGAWFSGLLSGSIAVVLAVVGLIAIGCGTKALSKWGGRGKYAWWRVIGSLGYRQWAGVGGLSLLFNLVFIFQFVVLARGWGGLPWTKVGAVPVIYALKGLAPLSFMDIGIREGAAVWVFETLSLDPAIGFNAAFAVFSFNVFMPGIIGAVLLVRHGPERQADDGQELGGH
jgi:hypothetical protein